MGYAKSVRLSLLGSFPRKIHLLDLDFGEILIINICALLIELSEDTLISGPTVIIAAKDC